MPPLQLSVALLASVLATHLRCARAANSKTWESEVDGANLIMQADNNQLNWGDWGPTTVIEMLYDICSGIACSSEPITMDTQVIEDGKSHMKTLTITVVDSTFSTESPGNAEEVLDALWTLANNPPYVEWTEEHWDQDTEQSSCASASDNFCWIPNKIEGDTYQYWAPRDMMVRFQEAEEPHSLISMIHITSEVTDQDGDEWDCAKIVDTAADVAGQVEKLPDTPFKVFSLVCDSLFGLGS